MSLIKKIAKNTFYQIAGKIASVLLGLGAIALITRYLGQTGFGYYTTIISYLQFSSVLVDFGLQMTTTQMLSRPGADEKKIFNNAFTLRFCSALVFLTLSALVAFLLPYPEAVKGGIVLASFSFLFISLQTVLVSLYQKHIDMAMTSISEVWSRLVLLIGIYLAISYDLGLSALLFFTVLGSAVNFFILYFSSGKYLRVRPAFDRNVWADIYRTTWPLAMTIALTLVYFRADTIIMSLFRPQNEVGLYGATYKVLEILVQFPYMFLGLVLPVMTVFFVSNREMFKLTVQKAFDFFVILIAPIILGCLLYGEKIMTFVAGSEFSFSGELLKVLIFAAAAIYFGSLFGYGIVAGELQKKMIKFYAFDAVLALVLYFIFIPIYSYWAAAIITVLSESIIAGCSYYILKKYSGLKISLKIFSKVLPAGFIMVLFLLLFKNQNILTITLVGAIVYFAVIFINRGVTRESFSGIVKIDN